MLRFLSLVCLAVAEPECEENALLQPKLLPKASGGKCVGKNDCWRFINKTSCLYHPGCIWFPKWPPLEGLLTASICQGESKPARCRRSAFGVHQQR